MKAAGRAVPTPTLPFLPPTRLSEFWCRQFEYSLHCSIFIFTTLIQFLVGISTFGDSMKLDILVFGLYVNPFTLLIV